MKLVTVKCTIPAITSLAIGLLLFALIPAGGSAQINKQFYAGVTGGYVMPRNLHENWNNTAHTQSADLTHEMRNGFLAGIKIGYIPKALKKILAAELEYNYQKADVNRITTPGFTAFTVTIPAFSNLANNSGTSFHSIFLNVMARYAEGIVHPYIGIGPGVTLSTISFNEPDLTAGYGFVETGEATNVSYQILGGVDFDISTNISIGGGYKYFATAPAITWANGTHSHYDPSSHNFVFHVKYYF